MVFYLYMTLVHGSRKSVISQFLVDVQETELAVNLGTAKGLLVACELDTLHLPVVRLSFHCVSIPYLRKASRSSLQLRAFGTSRFKA